MSKFDMFESRKEIRLDSTRVKRKLLVIKTSSQQHDMQDNEGRSCCLATTYKLGLHYRIAQMARKHPLEF